MFLCKPVSIKADKGWRIVLGEGSPHCLNQPVCALDTILTLQIKKTGRKVPQTRATTQQPFTTP